jgi:hypothetical protein
VGVWFFLSDPLCAPEWGDFKLFPYQLAAVAFRKLSKLFFKKAKLWVPLFFFGYTIVFLNGVL